MRTVNPSQYVFEVYTNCHVLGSTTGIVPRRAIWAYKRFSEVSTFHGDILQGSLCII